MNDSTSNMMAASTRGTKRPSPTEPINVSSEPKRPPARMAPGRLPMPPTMMSVSLKASAPKGAQHAHPGPLRHVAFLLMQLLPSPPWPSPVDRSPGLSRSVGRRGNPEKPPHSLPSRFGPSGQSVARGWTGVGRRLRRRLWRLAALPTPARAWKLCGSS